MAQTNSSLQRWEPIVLSILRIVIGLLILEHGTQKLFHFPPPDHPMGGPGGLPPLMMVAAGIELVGGLLLVLGLFTRPAALILSGFMAVAYFMAHASASLYRSRTTANSPSRSASSSSTWPSPVAGAGAWMQCGEDDIWPRHLRC